MNDANPYGRARATAARNLLKVLGTTAGRGVLALALGPQPGRELEARLRVAGLVDAAQKASHGNPTTARELTELGFNLLSGDERTARRAAKLLCSANPARGVRLVSRDQKLMQALRRADSQAKTGDLSSVKFSEAD
jgi:hypothetical protein